LLSQESEVEIGMMKHRHGVKAFFEIISLADKLCTCWAAERVHLR
jgi:hypothetical protein